MRNLTRLLGGVVICGGLVGCAASPEPAPAPYASVYDVPATTAAALAFDPPITIGQIGLDLSRETRGEAAFVGFEDPVTNYVDVFTYNRQASDRSDRYERDTVTERVGVVHR